MRNANLLLALLLELGTLAAVVYWGFGTDAGVAVQLVAGIGAPIVLAVLWGMFCSPKAAKPLRGVARVVADVAWFGCGAAALAASGAMTLAAAFGVAYVVNRIGVLTWHQGSEAAAAPGRAATE
ncbi:DUF2568 domain-containing protein [Solihabitans fulvus]|uniref:DUF2568 domain-containing protein n=1 Tax=Solihabitans fulvus TaxID=1892852 RepID=A0A5B2WQ02_9PSEU|nr:DUF2568 domain-containing protein [Solihabitans fulvus]